MLKNLSFEWCQKILAQKLQKLQRFEVKLSISQLQGITLLFLSINSTFCFHLIVISKVFELKFSDTTQMINFLKLFNIVMNFL